MKFNLDRTYLILGSIAIVCGMVMAFFEPIGGCLIAALGGIGLQLRIEAEPKKKTPKKVEPKA